MTVASRKPVHMTSLWRRKAITITSTLPSWKTSPEPSPGKPGNLTGIRSRCTPDGYYTGIAASRHFHPPLLTRGVASPQNLHPFLYGDFPRNNKIPAGRKSDGRFLLYSYFVSYRTILNPTKRPTIARRRNTAVSPSVYSGLMEKSFIPRNGAISIFSSFAPRMRTVISASLFALVT